MGRAINKVIVVEDDESMREALGRLLGAAGLEYASYASAEALLASGAFEGAGCVVSDMKLPAMSGLDLLASLRERGDRPCFILITAHDAPGLREEAKRQGVAAYLTKPFHSAALLAAINAEYGLGGPCRV